MLKLTIKKLTRLVTWYRCILCIKIGIVLLEGPRSRFYILMGKGQTQHTLVKYTSYIKLVTAYWLCFLSELAIGKDPNVESCIVFGTGHTQCGILIQPRKDLVFDPSETEKLGEYRDAVWYVVNLPFSSPFYIPTHSFFRPTIMKVNESSPPHSRINKEVCIHV